MYIFTIADQWDDFAAEQQRQGGTLDAIQSELQTQRNRLGEMKEAQGQQLAPSGKTLYLSPVCPVIQVFQQIVGIPIGTNCMCSSSIRHISLLICSRMYTVFSLNRQETVGMSVQFQNYLGQMYPLELEIKDKTESARRSGIQEAGWTVDRTIKIRFSAYPYGV